MAQAVKLLLISAQVMILLGEREPRIELKLGSVLGVELLKMLSLTCSLPLPHLKLNMFLIK